MTRFEIFFTIIKIPLDFLAVFMAALLAYFLRPFTDLIPFIQIPFLPEQLLPLSSFIIFSWCASIFFIVISSFNRLYYLKNNKNIVTEFYLIFLSTIYLVLGIISFYALFKVETFFSRGVLLMMSVFIIIFTLSWRLILKSIEYFLLKKGIGIKKIAIWGDSQILENVIPEINKNINYKIVYQSNKFQKEDINISKINELWFVKSKNNNDGKEILEFAQVHQLTYRFIPDVFGTLHTNVEGDTLGHFPLLRIKYTPIEGWGRISKRIFDIIFSLIFTILSSIFFVIIAIIIKLESKGPVFYVSKRIGKYGKEFKMIKFRSMVDKADLQKEQFANKNHRQDSPLFKIKNDPRITKFGKFLRRYSIDELPNFYNVLWGNMSIVGPRPHLPQEVKKYSLDQKRVLTIKPGITGLAQINGRSDLKFTDEIRLDLHYIVNWSVFLDLKIIFKTPWVLLKGEGAD